MATLAAPVAPVSEMCGHGDSSQDAGVSMDWVSDAIIVP